MSEVRVSVKDLSGALSSSFCSISAPDLDGVVGCVVVAGALLLVDAVCASTAGDPVSVLLAAAAVVAVVGVGAVPLFSFPGVVGVVVWPWSTTRDNVDVCCC